MLLYAAVPVCDDCGLVCLIWFGVVNYGFCGVFGPRAICFWVLRRAWLWLSSWLFDFVVVGVWLSVDRSVRLCDDCIWWLVSVVV